MKIYPASAEEKLGFLVLRERLDEYTLSRLGQERLVAMQPARHLDWLRDELARVAELQQAFRFDDPVPFDHVLDVREVLRQAAPEEAFVGPEEFAALRLALRTMRRLHDYFAARRAKYPHLSGLSGRITPVQALEDAIAGVVDDEARVRDDASPELRRLRQLIVRRQAALRETLLRELRRAVGQGFATEEQPTIRNGRMVIPVRAEAKRKVQGFVQDTSATGQTVYIEPAACLDLNNEVRELEADERREVERLLRVLTARVRERLDTLRENLRALAALDLLQAKARLANELEAVVPGLNDDGVFDLRAARNPVLLLFFRRQYEARGRDARRDEGPRQVVPLDLPLGAGYHTLVITGPNAGGKTVAMKTVGLLALMLAYGLPIPADETSNCCLFGRLMVDIGDEQSMEEDLSTFSSHVANLKYMLRHADARTLILIDEAGTGTDPAEGGALAQAVLERLTDAGTRTIATTHHGTLKVFAHETDGVENGSMAFDQQNLSPTYHFQAGVPGASYAFDIAQRIGLDGDVLQRARALVGHQKTALEELISTFEQRKQDLESRLEQADATVRRAAHEERQYADRAEKLRKERTAIRAQALEEAERIVGEANARVERTIREIKEAQAEKEATQSARAGLASYRDDVAKRKGQAERGPARRTRPPAERPTPEEPTTPAEAPGPIRPGDQVVLDGGATAAEVLEIEDDEAVLALGSMRVRAAMDRLTKVGGPRRQQVTVRELRADAGDLAATRARTRVDLRGQRVEEALSEVMRLLDEAVAAGLDRVEILHGKGTGALRQAIHQALDGRPEVSAYEEAPWDQGGAGVTHVHLT